MRNGKKTLIITISVFSPILLGNMTIQQAKADTTGQQLTGADQKYSKGSPVEANQQQPVTQPEENETPTQPSNDETQQVTIGFKDQNNNPILDAGSKEYVIKSNYSTGAAISPSDFSDKFNSDLNGGYTINPNQSPVTVEQGNNNYTFNVTAKTYPMTVYNYNASSTAGGIDSTPEKKQDVNLTIGDQTSITHDESFNGFGFSNLNIEPNNNPLPDSQEGNANLTYDFIPYLQKLPSNRYLLIAFYSKALEQPIPIQYVDDQGQAIPGVENDTLNGYKTNDALQNVDLSDFTNKQIPEYTFIRALPFDYTVSPSSIIQLMYINNNLNYLQVEYRDKNTDKIVYSDYLRGQIGDTVAIKNIQNMDNFQDRSKYQLVDSQQATNYQIKSNNEKLVVDVEKLPFTFNLVQSFGDDLIYTQSFKVPFGDEINPTASFLSNNISDIQAVDYNIPGYDPGHLSSDDLTSFDNTSNFINQLINGSVSDSKSGQTAMIDIHYNPSIINTINQIIINYQTSDNSAVSKKVFQTTPADISTIEHLIKDNTPTGYNLNNNNSITNFENGSLEIAAAVEKNPGSNNSNGSSNHKPDTDNNNETLTAVNKTISLFSDLSEVTIYDDSGQTTNNTIPANSDWYTDQKKVLNGRTFYRIASNQWINENDIYTYNSNHVFIQTHADSPKSLVSERNKLSTNRGLAPNSSWYSDRYTSLDGQKYYRVATNEWVNSDDVFEYQPIKKVIQPVKNAQLFNDKGKFVGMAPKYALITDKIANINGTQMFRVATNEWLPTNYVK